MLRTQAHEDLRVKLRELELIIQHERADRAKDMSHFNKEKENSITDAVLKERANTQTAMNNLRAEVAGLKAANEQLGFRIKEQPTAMLQEFIKALLVKFPTIDLKDINFVYKEK